MPQPFPILTHYDTHYESLRSKFNNEHEDIMSSKYTFPCPSLCSNLWQEHFWTRNDTSWKAVYFELVMWYMIQDESEILMLIWNSITMTSKNVTAFQITGVSLACLTVSSGADLIKHQSSASLAFVRGIHRWPVDSPICGLNAEDFLVCILCQVYE